MYSDESSLGADERSAPLLDQAAQPSKWLTVFPRDPMAVDDNSVPSGGTTTTTTAIEPLQKDPGTWIENLGPRLESFILHLIPDQRVFALCAPKINGKLSYGHLRRCVYSAQTEKAFNEKKNNWCKISNQLSREPFSATKNNSIRQFYRAEGHMFLVKIGFTFGLCKVNPGTQHVYQMSQVPLLCFYLPEENKTKVASRARRAFVASDETWYVPYIFQPHENYIVPPGTWYVIVAMQKTLFSIQVIPDTIQLASSKYFPFNRHRRLDKISYEFPPPTPCHSGQEEKMVAAAAAPSFHVNAPEKRDWKNYTIPKKTLVATTQKSCEDVAVTSVQLPFENSNSDATCLSSYSDSQWNNFVLELSSNMPSDTTINSMEVGDLLSSIPSNQDHGHSKIIYVNEQSALWSLIQNDGRNFSIEEHIDSTFAQQPQESERQHVVQHQIVQQPSVEESPAAFTTTTKASSYPFKTHFVTTPWSRKSIPLTPPPIRSRNLNCTIRPAHEKRTTHSDHLPAGLDEEHNLYERRDSPGQHPEPLDLRVNQYLR